MMLFPEKDSLWGQAEAPGQGGCLLKHVMGWERECG